MSSVQPISVQLGNYGVEQLAQTSKESVAPAQQTGQFMEMVKKNEKRLQEVQPSDQVEIAHKVHRKTDEEHNEEKRKQQEEGMKNKKEHAEEEPTMRVVSVKKNGGYDFYA